MTVDPIAARRASIRHLLDRAGRGVLTVSEAELLRQQVEAEQRAADHIEAALARIRDRAEVATVHAERAEHERERDRLREQIHEERERMRTSFREQDAENARLRERAEKAERAANLLADSHRRAEQAKAELQRLRTESPWLRATAEDLTTAQAAIARVRALHKPADYRGRTICTACSAYCGSSTDNAPVEHPCPTLEALDEPKEPTP